MTIKTKSNIKYASPQVRQFDDVSDLSGLTGKYDGEQISVKGYHPSTSVGGGDFFYDATRAKSSHNGGTVISPTVTWDGTQGTLADFLNGVGETDPGGFGCWVRKDKGFLILSEFGAQGLSDDTVSFVKAAAIGGNILLTGTVILKPDTTAEVSLISNTTIVGLGRGISNLLVSESSNPASSVYGLRSVNVSNITIKNLSFYSDAAAQNIFNLGSLQPDGTYSPDGAGNLYGMRVEGTDNITFEDVEIYGFNGAGGVLFTNNDGDVNYNTNVSILNCHGHDNRETAFTLQACDGFKILGGLYENNGLQVFDSVDANGNPTSTTRTTTNYIDGGTGYGIVLGRSTTATKLKCKNGICKGVRTKRNVRHGIDVHAGVDIDIVDCHSEDDLLTAFGIQDVATSLDNTTGDINIKGGSIVHTVYSENRGYLFDDRTAGVERDDSNPIFVSNLSGEIDNVVISGVNISSWRYRQLSTYSATDTNIVITASANEQLVLEDINILADIADYYPSKIIAVTAGTCVIKGNTIKYGTRGTFDRAAFRFESTNDNTSFADNNITQVNTYSTGITQVARSMFDKVSATDQVLFTSNHIKTTAQVVKGSLWETTSGNALFGYRNLLAVNESNTLNGEPYGSTVNVDKTFYLSAAGAGNQDGSSASNAFAANNAANLQAIFDQLPQPTLDKTITMQFLDGAYTLIGSASIGVDGWQLLGNASELTVAATTKSVDFDNSGASDFNLSFPKYGLRGVIKGIQTRSANGLTIKHANVVEGCVIENGGSSAGSDYGVYRETGELLCARNYFTGGYAAIGAFENCSVVSIVNQDTGTQPVYGLNTNGGVIMKNSTQPTGSTANELAQNGGVIR